VQPAQPWSQQIQKQPQESKIAPPSTKVDGKVFEEILTKPQPVSDMKTGIDVLLYGDTNVGKTYCSMTFPEPIFVIDTEKRAEKSKKYHYPGKDIRIFDPVTIKDDYVDDEDAIDYAASIDNITNFVVALNRKIQSGEITQGTLVVDSLTDIWKWVQEWGKVRLAKKGKLDRELMSIKNQFDWGIMNGKNARLMMLFKHVTRKGLNFVGTARETNVPDYVQANQTAKLPTEKIRVQKDVPFVFSSILNLKLRRIKTPTGFNTKYLTDVVKLDTLDYNQPPIENIDFEKIKGMLEKLAVDTKEKK